MIPFTRMTTLARAVRNAINNPDRNLARYQQLLSKDCSSDIKKDSKKEPASAEPGNKTPSFSVQPKPVKTISLDDQHRRFEPTEGEGTGAF